MLDVRCEDVRGMAVGLFASSEVEVHVDRSLLATPQHHYRLMVPG